MSCSVMVPYGPVPERAISGFSGSPVTVTVMVYSAPLTELLILASACMSSSIPRGVVCRMRTSPWVMRNSLPRR